jgi:RNA polymerase sigma-70 factor (ECF subfamily)
MVLLAGQDGSQKAQAALEELCRLYWYPLYAYVRRRGYEPHDAQDMTQAFFARFLEKNYLGSVDRRKGRFRSFLLASLKHFLADEWDRARAQKRGGNYVFIPFDEQSAEAAYRLEPSQNSTAEKIFERRWALTLLDQVMNRLQREYVENGQKALFEQLKGSLMGSGDSAPHAEIAARLGMSEGAVRVAAHRMRRGYREHLRTEIAQTVDSPGEIDDEIRCLLAALS